MTFDSNRWNHLNTLGLAVCAPQHLEFNCKRMASFILHSIYFQHIIISAPMIMIDLSSRCYVRLCDGFLSSFLLYLFLPFNLFFFPVGKSLRCFKHPNHNRITLFASCSLMISFFLSIVLPIHDHFRLFFVFSLMTNGKRSILSAIESTLSHQTIK